MWLRHDLVKPSYWLAGWHGNDSRIISPLWWESFRQRVSLQKGPVMQSFDISLLLTRTSCWAHCRVSGDLRHLNTPVAVLIQSYSFRQIFPSLTDYSHIVCELPLQLRQSERLWRLKSPASRLFTQPFVQAQITEKSKLRVWGEFTDDQWFPAQKASISRSYLTGIDTAFLRTVTRVKYNC